jgi:hypothetical protein
VQDGEMISTVGDRHGMEPTTPLYNQDPNPTAPLASNTLSLKAFQGRKLFGRVSLVRSGVKGRNSTKTRLDAGLSRGRWVNVCGRCAQSLPSDPWRLISNYLARAVEGGVYVIDERRNQSGAGRPDLHARRGRTDAGLLRTGRYSRMPPMLDRTSSPRCAKTSTGKLRARENLVGVPGMST